MKSSNPTMNEKLIRDFAFQRTESGVMTVQGTVNKIAIMLLLALAGAAFSWSKFFKVTEPAAAGSTVLVWMLVGGIGGFVVALITMFKKEWSPILAPIYAVLEGLFIGAISAFFEAMYPGLVLRAVSLTFAVLFALLFAYKSRIIKVTDKLRAGIFAATAGIAVAYLVSFILGLFGMNMSFMHGGGTLGIIISLVIVVVAALNLVLDFDFIEKGSQAGLPGYFEWYGAFGLMVTLIWLYLEILRLLSYLSGRD
ncbi:MAG TPA: hypothetical protein DEQ03_05140 [Marinilabiliales bacterium]|nr:hypothetical protein [Marinilabiliales bacterium]